MEQSEQRGARPGRNVTLTDVFPHRKNTWNEKLVSQLIILNKLLSCIFRDFTDKKTTLKKLKKRCESLYCIVYSYTLV